MPSRRNELGDKAVMMLATAWVVLCGAAASVFLIVSGSTSPMETIGTCGACAAGGAFVLWLLGEKAPGTERADLFRWFRRKKVKVVHYQLKVRKSSQTHHDPAPQPPTAERIRELADESAGTWVPSRTTKDYPDPQKRR